MTHFSGKIFRAKIGRRSAEIILGARLQEIRVIAGVTQEQLAVLLNTSRGAISRIENSADLRISTLKRYIEALGARLHVDAWFSELDEPVSDFRESTFTCDIDENQLVLPILRNEVYPKHRDVIFSIKPKYSEQIVEGKKTVELRRRFPESVPPGTTALIYTTSPTMALTGIAQIADVVKQPVTSLWDRFSTEACVEREAFDSYFLGLEVGFAIHLKNARPLKRSLSLNELRERFGFEPPQSYLYAKSQMRQALRYECSEVFDRH